MTTKKLILFIAVALLVFSIAPTAPADIFQVPLDCAGDYLAFQTWTTDIDLGTSFSEITSARITWSGEIIAEVVTGGGQDYLDGQFVASLYDFDREDCDAQAFAQGGAQTYPDPEPFDLISPFSASIPPTDWSSLLDGQTTIEVGLFGVFRYFNVITLAHPSGTLDQATLIIEGTPVPEPATVLLFAPGLCLMRLRKKRSISIVS